MSCNKVFVLAALLAISSVAQGYARGLLNKAESRNENGEQKVDIATAALKAANITAANSTIFAPSDKAFKKLLKTLNLTNASNLSKPQYANISAESLKLHVIPGKVLKAADIPFGNTTLTTLTGKNITIRKYQDEDDNEVEVKVKGPGNKKSYEVEKADVPFGSNIVHVIDGVLLP